MLAVCIGVARCVSSCEVGGVLVCDMTPYLTYTLRLALCTCPHLQTPKHPWNTLSTAKLIGFSRAKPYICCSLTSLTGSDAVYDLIELTPAWTRSIPVLKMGSLCAWLTRAE